MLKRFIFLFPLIMFIFSPNVDAQTAQSLLFSTDPNTQSGGNPIVWFFDFVPTSINFCFNGGSCTGFIPAFDFVPIGGPQAVFAGLSGTFGAQADGTNISAIAFGSGSQASCVIFTYSNPNGSYRYCGEFPDNDGDGVSNTLDSCPITGNQGYGVNSIGCPETIPDMDNDGKQDNVDQCPTIYALTPSGCPDTDGDGGHDLIDQCPNQAGPANTYCPGTTPQPIDTDRDNDSFLNDADSCPDTYGVSPDGCPDRNEDESDTNIDRIPDIEDDCPRVPGPSINNGCPYNPDNCQIANWRIDKVNVRAGASTETDVLGQFSNDQFPLDVLGIEGDWYLVSFNGGTAYVNKDFVEKGTLEGCGQVTSNDGDALEFAIEQLEQQCGSISDSQRNALTTATDYQQLLIAISPDDPCSALEKLNASGTVPVAVVTDYVLVSNRIPSMEEVIAQIATCNPNLIARFREILENPQRNGYSFDTVAVLQALGTTNICEKLQEIIDNGLNSGNFTGDEAIAVGVVLCRPSDMAPKRFDDIVNNIINTWNIPLEAVTCDLIDIINRIGTPSRQQMDLFSKFLSCQMPYDKAFIYLQNAIASGNDTHEDVDLSQVSCTEIEINYSCTDCTYYEVSLGVFEECVARTASSTSVAYIRKQIAIYLKNHEPLLTERERELILNAESPCDAVLRYLEIGIITPIQNDVIAPVVTIVDNTPTPTLVVQSTVTTPPSPTIVQILLDGVIEPSFFRAKSVFVRTENGNDNIYVIQDQQEVQIDTEVQGEKYYPILFKHNQYTYLVYTLEDTNGVKIRIVNLDVTTQGTRNGYNPTMPDGVQPILARVTFISPWVIFSANDGNIYALDFESLDLPFVMMENAENPSGINRSNALIFERPGSDGNIHLWANGIISENPIDKDINGECFSPIASYINRDALVWFVCNVNGNRVVYTTSLYNFNPLEEEVQGVQPETISLAEIEGDFYLDDGNEIYIFSRNTGRSITTKVIGGGQSERSRQISVLR